MSAKAEGKEVVYPIDQLREYSQELFGVKVEVFDGALFGVSAEEVTKTEVKKRIDAFLKKEVKG